MKCQARTKGIRSFLAASHFVFFVFFVSFCFFLTVWLAKLTCEENGDSDGMKEINMPQYVNDKHPRPPLSLSLSSQTNHPANLAKVKYVQVLLLTLPVNKYYLSDTKKWHSIIQQMFSARRKLQMLR